MRLWHYKLLPYLPDAQFKGQLRELILIMHQWRDNGTTNHLLINRVMEYPKGDLTSYFLLYDIEYQKRYLKEHGLIANEFVEFSKPDHFTNVPFKDWHNKEYLRVCVCNLYEKYHFGVGKSKISQAEWDRVLQGYKEITGEDWIL
jgi:uncharacterized protein (TIGR02328 family)